MTNVFEEFKKWLSKTYEEQYDPNNNDHLIRYSIFEAGWDAREDLSR